MADGFAVDRAALAETAQGLNTVTGAIKDVVVAGVGDPHMTDQQAAAASWSQDAAGITGAQTPGGNMTWQQAGQAVKQQREGVGQTALGTPRAKAIKGLLGGRGAGTLRRGGGVGAGPGAAGDRAVGAGAVGNGRRDHCLQPARWRPITSRRRRITRVLPPGRIRGRYRVSPVRSVIRERHCGKKLVPSETRFTWDYHPGTFNPLRFPGQYADPETGLHYNNQRYYDPVTGAYLSPDPLGLSAAPNPHAYVPNPHVLIDPLGLAADDSYGADNFITANDVLPSIRGRMRAAGPGDEYGLPNQEISATFHRVAITQSIACIDGHKEVIWTGSATSGSLGHPGPLVNHSN